ARLSLPIKGRKDWLRMFDSSDIAAAREQQTPPQHERLTADEATVREHIRIIHEQAARTCKGIKDPGYLQIVRINPWDRNPRPVPALYRIGDIEGMVQQVLTDAAAGHNCYIEARTVNRSAVSGK